MSEYMKGYDIGRKHGLTVETAHLKYIRQAIQFDLDEAKESFSDCENETDKAFQQGRIFAHNYDLIVIDRMLKENGNAVEKD